MKKITIYIADDGTEFNNKYDCENYEFKIKVLPVLKNCRAYNKDFTPILISDNFEFARDMFYIYIDSENAFNVISDISEKYGYVSPRDTCSMENKKEIFLCYDNSGDDWYDIYEKITKYKNMIERMK